MVWVREQIKTAASVSGAPTLELDAAATAGQLIVVCFATRASTGQISPQSGYSEAVEDADVALIAIHYKVAAGGETTIAPVQSTTDDPWTLSALEYSGNGSGDPLDQTDYNGSGTDTVDTLGTTLTGTLAEATELGIVMSAHHAVSGDSTTWDNGYSLVLEVQSSGGAAAGRVAQSVGEQFDVGTAAEESQGAWANARRSACSIVTFKAAAAAADVYPPFPSRQRRLVRM